MQNIAHKNKNMTTQNFLNMSTDESYIDGINLDIIMTKDERILYFTSVTTSVAEISQLQENNYQEIKEGQFLTLEEVLEIMKDSGKKILINIITIYNLTESNLNQINISNRRFVYNVLNTISKYKNLKYYIYSSNNTIINLLKQDNDNYEIGYNVSEDNLNFEDVNFYVMRPNLLNKEIVDMLLQRNKIIMINMIDNDDLVVTLNNIDKQNSNFNDYSKKDVYYISRYPKVVDKMIMQ